MSGVVVGVGAVIGGVLGGAGSISGINKANKNLTKAFREQMKYLQMNYNYNQNALTRQEKGAYDMALADLFNMSVNAMQNNAQIQAAIAESGTEGRGAEKISQVTKGTTDRAKQARKDAYEVDVFNIRSQKDALYIQTKATVAQATNSLKNNYIGGSRAFGMFVQGVGTGAALGAATAGAGAAIGGAIGGASGGAAAGAGASGAVAGGAGATGAGTTSGMVLATEGGTVIGGSANLMGSSAYFAGAGATTSTAGVGLGTATMNTVGGASLASGAGGAIGTPSSGFQAFAQNQGWKLSNDPNFFKRIQYNYKYNFADSVDFWSNVGTAMNNWGTELNRRYY